MTASATTSRLSGIQRDVFSLYRRILRQALHKDRTTLATTPTTVLPFLLTRTGTTTHYATHEFRRQANSVSRSDFQKIEYLLRQGDKQIKLMNMPGVRRVVSSRTDGK